MVKDFRNGFKSQHQSTLFTLLLWGDRSIQSDIYPFVHSVYTSFTWGDRSHPILERSAPGDHLDPFFSTSLSITIEPSCLLSFFVSYLDDITIGVCLKQFYMTWTSSSLPQSCVWTFKTPRSSVKTLLQGTVVLRTGARLTDPSDPCLLDPAG